MASRPRILLYGPPAVGKSTLLRCLHSAGDDRLQKATVIDLESVQNACRERVVADISNWNFCGPLFVGAANLFPPNHFPWQEWQVVGLLYKSEDRYLERVARRKAENAETADQDELNHFRSIRTHVENNQRNIAVVVDPLNFEGKPRELWLEILRRVSL